MPVSFAKLKALLDVDEPDYQKLAEIAADAMHHLRRLAASADPSVASKAISLAGIIGDTGSVAVIRNAARSRNALVRAAAAHAASMLPDTPQAAKVVGKLLGDADIGVAKIAVRAATRQSNPAVAAKARRAKARLGVAVRRAMKQHLQRERAAAMAMKARSKRSAKAARGKTLRRRARGDMPAGAMAQPPRGAKARNMPTGRMK